MGMGMSKGQKIAAYEGRRVWASQLLDKIAPKGNRVGVEVGLWKGDFGQIMLKHNDRLHWYGVDPYFQYGRKKRGQAEWDDICRRVVGKFKPYGDRFTLVRKPSSTGVAFIPDNVDFVFIDGNHDEDMVLNDITLYEPKVRSGGIMAGHDYSLPKGRDGIRNAVSTYLKTHKRELHVDNSFDPCGVFWWVVK